MVLRIVDDRAALLSVVNNGMQDVRTLLALSHAHDAITIELSLQRFKQIDLGAFAELFCGLLLKGALQFFHLVGQLLTLFEGG